MWQMIGLGLAISVGVLALLGHEAESSHRQYSAACDRLQHDTQQQKKLIKQSLKQARHQSDFYAKVALHHASMQVANQSYELYQHAKTVRQELYTQLRWSGEHIGQLKVARDAAVGAARQSYREALQRQYDLHAEIKQGIAAYDQQIAQQLDELRELNAHTAELKYDIRDHTGKFGREWYERLEDRRLARRDDGV